MAKKVLVIPDIHGETFWKAPVQKYIDQVDRIVFLGDQKVKENTYLFSHAGFTTYWINRFRAMFYDR